MLISKKKIVLLGGGLIGQEHAKLVHKNPLTTLAGISDILEDAEKYAHLLDVTFYNDYEKLLDQQQPDGAIIAAPNKLHAPLTQACLDRGIPFLVEKLIADPLLVPKYF